MPTVPADPPGRCPVCDAEYDSVSVHTEGVMVALAENERYRRVCFEPASEGGRPVLEFYHHAHDVASAETDTER